MRSIFVTATDTNVGKTYFSIDLIKSIIKSGSMKASEIAYYKPVQTGCTDEFVFDTVTVTNANLGIDIYNTYSFDYPASPDYSSKLENAEIKISKIIANRVKKNSF
jgi:dethiobiotin synthetase